MERDRESDRPKEVESGKQTYSTGTKYADFAVKGNNCFALLNKGGMTFFLVLEKPTNEELSVLGSGQAVKLYLSEYAGIGCLFARFGKMLFDFPVHPRTITDMKKDEVKDCLNDNTLTLHILVFDSTDGTLVLIRECQILTGFSVAFIEWIQKNFENEISVSELQQLYDAYCSEFSADEIIDQASFSGTIK